jgi:hypothetical protein
MQPWVWIIVALVLVALAALAYWYSQQQQTKQLRQRFGSEYDHSVQTLGDERRAQEELQRRAERVEHLELRPLSPEDRQRFGDSWQSVQAMFVDDPARATKEADALITEVMRVRGYPTTDFEQRAADISVEHPAVVEHYRAAYAIARRSERGEAPTEDLRQAFVHYRALFQDLLEAGSVPGPVQEGEEARDDRVWHKAA